MLNEGTIVIQRQGAAVNTSDEEEDSEVDEVKEEEEEVVEDPEPERDPLDVEEEALQEKLQTAGFLLSMPEEEHIRKRLLEIKWVSVIPTSSASSSISLSMSSSTGWFLAPC